MDPLARLEMCTKRECFQQGAEFGLIREKIENREMFTALIHPDNADRLLPSLLSSCADYMFSSDGTWAILAITGYTRGS